ncbi:MAG: hypothetical protein ACM3ML_37790 [Micromonosporaceae bacterium]
MDARTDQSARPVADLANSEVRGTSPSARRIEIVLVVCGVLVGFALTLAALVTFGHQSGGRAPISQSPATIESGGGSDGGSGSEPAPAALDGMWASYSSRSTCADWAGGDGVSAIRLNTSQVAWFFSDTFLGPAGPDIGFSHVSGFVHNAVVMQTTNGLGSKFVTLTGGGTCSGPGQSSVGAASVVSAPEVFGQARDRYWDADGLRVGGQVFKFYNLYLPGVQPFVPVGTAIARFSVSQLAASGHGPVYGGVARPRVTTLPAFTPLSGGTPIVWGSAVLRVGETAYIYGWQSADARVNVRVPYLAKVPVHRIADMSAWRFYAGAGQWAAGQQNAQPIEPPGSDFSVSAGFSVVPMGGEYWLIQQDVQAGGPDIDAYPAPAPWGPFDPSHRVVIYRSGDIGLDPAHDYRIMYEARAEPALSTRKTLVISYNVNSAAVTTGCASLAGYTNTILQPRFITVPRAAFAATGPSSLSRYRAGAGPSPYPAIISKNPSQWFNGWDYPGGCPPVPAVKDVAAHQAGGSVWLEWPDTGLGLHYRVYLRKPGRTRYTLVRTVSSPGTRLTGLARGQTYQVRVVPVNAHHRRGGGAVTTVTVR